MVVECAEGGEKGNYVYRTLSPLDLFDTKMGNSVNYLNLPLIVCVGVCVWGGGTGFAKESRGCNVLKSKRAQKLCRARGPTDENIHFAMTEVNSTQHWFNYNIGHLARLT